MTVMQAPGRSIQQRLEALEKGNGIRVYRARLKRDVKAGRVVFADLVDGGDPRLATMKVFDLLLAVPAVGRVKALKALQRAGVSPSKTMGGMTPRQRRDLLRHLPSSVRAVRNLQS